ncbi:MAG: AAA family ATPase, partial [Clostridia bacterium]|nr:AAA family ATPase [Clostridia bacterium]
TEATGAEARTIHRLLEYVPGEGFQRNRDNPIFYDMVIVDEVSMVDVPLMQALLSAIPQGTRLVMVGDADQLPPVGAGNVLSDIIASGCLRVVRLTEIFRQAERSMIVTNAHRINEGRMPRLDAPESDFRFEELAAQEQILRRIVELCTGRAGVLKTGEPLLDVQVLAPLKKGVLGVYNLNARLQQALNPAAPDKREHAFGETVLREGDRVMQVKNDYKIEWTRRGPHGEIEEGTGAFNGDLGTVFRIDAANRRIRVLFDDDRMAAFEFTQLDEIQLAYCISIHKSQGSEFPIVVLPLFGGASPILTRNLLYTAVTRARRQVVCVGRRECVAAMLQNTRSNRRYTALRERLLEMRELFS